MERSAAFTFYENNVFWVKNVPVHSVKLQATKNTGKQIPVRVTIFTSQCVTVLVPKGILCETEKRVALQNGSM